MLCDEIMSGKSELVRLFDGEFCEFICCWIIFERKLIEIIEEIIGEESLINYCDLKEFVFAYKL